MRWLEPTPANIPDELRAFVGGHVLVVERLTRIGLTTIAAARAFLDPAAYTPASPFELPDLEVAVKRLKRAISTGQRVLIWGDFDVDGQTATALLFDALRRMGANVRYHVPLRQGEGHGIYLPKLRDWLTKGVDVLMTCDTGITAHDAVDVAQAAGVDVVITDHHMLGDTLPAAHAVINPMRLRAGHALRDLPGVGVAWQLIAALSNEVATTDLARELLDFVALGIVADVAIQARDTRYLLQRGLETLRVSSRPGIRALFERAEIDPLELTEIDIGFKLGPRLNAQGRLGDATACVELLTTNDEARAAELANQLEGMNARRKLETRLIEDSAMSMIERDPSLVDYAAIVLSHAEWSGGIVGIVANRLAETYHKPVILLGERDDLAFGSARSVPGCNITDAIQANRDIVIKFGGHAMAAGLSLKRDSVYDFRRRISRTVREMAPGAAEEPMLEIDGYLGLEEISLGLAEDLRRLAPFGNGNRPLNLATRGLRLVRRKKLGSRGNHLELLVEDEAGTQQRILWWQARESMLPAGRFDLAYNLTISRFKDAREVSMQVVDMRPAENESLEVNGGVTGSAPAFEIEDLSGVADRRRKLDEVLSQSTDPIVWREMDESVGGWTRNELRRAETLVIWTAPPGPEEWRAALRVVRPRRVVFFGQRPQEVRAESFLRRLGGLAKHVLSSGEAGGQTTIDALAAATAQRTTAVRYGLRWFVETGRLDVEVRGDGTVRLSWPSQGAMPMEKPQIEILLQNVLDETSAYRASGVVVFG